MPIEVHVNSDLALQVVRFSGRISVGEATELGRFHENRPDMLAVDSVQILDDGVDLSELTPSRLDPLRRHYNNLLRSADLILVRRSGWICSSASACEVVEYWLDGRHSRDGQNTEVCLAASLEDLSELFSVDEIAEITAWRGFFQVARIDQHEATEAA